MGLLRPRYLSDDWKVLFFLKGKWMEAILEILQKIEIFEEGIRKKKM
jgi:hypothetical protein